MRQASPYSPVSLAFWWSCSMPSVLSLNATCWQQSEVLVWVVTWIVGLTLCPFCAGTRRTVEVLAGRAVVRVVSLQKVFACRAVPWTRCSVKQAVVKHSVVSQTCSIRLRVQSLEHLCWGSSISQISWHICNGALYTAIMYTLLLMKYILLENVKLVMCSELILGLPILKACCDGQKESKRPLLRSFWTDLTLN